jgi:hypothetical protein
MMVGCELGKLADHRRKQRIHQRKLRPDCPAAGGTLAEEARFTTSMFMGREAHLLFGKGVTRPVREANPSWQDWGRPILSRLRYYNSGSLGVA